MCNFAQTFEKGAALGALTLRRDNPTKMNGTHYII